MAQTQTHPPSPLPYDPTAFYQPSDYEKALNQGYWQGYAIGQMVCTGIPGPAGAYDPAGVNDYAYYQTWVYPCLLPTTNYGYPNDPAVGFDNALIQWSNWLWTHDPQSPHKVPPPAK
jgi:hypothetical protein